MKSKLLFGIIFLFVCMTFSVPLAGAQDDSSYNDGCDTGGIPSYSGTLKLQTDTYDAFVRLAKRGEQATVRAYSQAANDAGCFALGEAQASGDRWTKLGQFTAKSSQEYAIELSSETLANLPDANRPAIMLVPRDNPVCTPTVECELTIDGQAGFVRPTGTLLSENSLHVLLVTNPAESTISKVRYFVDNKLVYETTKLQPFDLRFVSYPRQKLVRAIIYDNGQQIILPSEAPSAHQDSFSNLLFRTGSQYPNLITGGLALLGVITFVTAGLAMTHALWHHRNWQYNHGILRNKADHELTDKERALIHKRRVIVRKTKLILLGISLAVSTITIILLANTYLAQIFNVDGRSMRNTYFTGEKVLINKIPSSLASLNGREYVPSRGDVVVARAVFGSVASDLDTGSEIYIIKRVLALPGERVVVKDGVLTVFNKDNPDGFQPDKDGSWRNTFIANEKTEQLDIQLSESELFLSGDNRPESIDSRFNGPIAAREIVGKATKVWPLFGHSKPAGDE